jgi:hypothetical protein
LSAHAPPEALAAALRRVPGVRSVTVEEPEPAAARCLVVAEAGHDVRAALAAAVAAEGWPLLALARAEPSLEQIFLELVEAGGPPP